QRAQVPAEPRDYTLQPLDNISEEQAVDYLKPEQQDRCGSLPSAPAKAREESAVTQHSVEYHHEGKAAEPAGHEGNDLS
ncbi:nitrate reductase molybdenum cofactor assembly chaperone, partial [Pseudomonas sp. 5C2]|nr:nitrate reductase molybdenum cofactor assembly chaperone [Pseudomonas sp. 5C2]